MNLKCISANDNQILKNFMVTKSMEGSFIIYQVTLMDRNALDVERDWFRLGKPLTDSVLLTGYIMISAVDNERKVIVDYPATKAYSEFCQSVAVAIKNEMALSYQPKELAVDKNKAMAIINRMLRNLTINDLMSCDACAAFNTGKLSKVC